MERTRPRRFSRRRFLAAGAASVFLVLETAETAFPHIPYETDPYNVRDSTFWRIFRGPFGGVMKLCGAEDKESNYWQWIKTNIPQFRASALLRGNFSTFIRDDTIDDIRMSCHGINEVYQLKPLRPDTWRLIFQTVHRTQAGTIEPYESMGNLFSGKLDGTIKFMRGNGDVRIFAMDQSGERMPLEVTGPFSRDDKSIGGDLI